MTISRDSLGGKNGHRGVAGARSSRALSTIFKRLRKLDKEIGRIDRMLHGWRRFCFKQVERLSARRKKLDEKRKEVRWARKQFGREKQLTAAGKSE